MAILHFVVPANNSWKALGSGTQLLIVGITTEILQDFLQKSWFAGTMLTNFIFVRKHRTYFPLTILITVGTFICFPVLLAIILISSVFSSPLLPLFTLPVFLVSFPRAKRFWPSLINYASSYSKCQDSIYYQQAEVEIANVIHQAVSCGAILATPGTYLLLRFEDRLMVVTFLEHGYAHCVLAVKGLELQETSCHSIEATRIDGIFEDAYDPSSKNCPRFWFNTHFSNTLQPVDSKVIKVYSDAHNVLTGIIDQPLSLRRFSDNLLKCLVWVLYHHFLQAAAATNEHQNNELKVSSTENGYIHRQANCDSGCSGVAKGNVNDSKSAWTEEMSTRVPTSVKQESTTKEGTLSWSESISSIDDVFSMQNGKQNIDTVYALDAVDSLPGLIPQDRPLSRPRQRSTTIIVDNMGHPNDEDGITQSEVRLSAIPISGISKLQQVGDLDGLIEIPVRWMEELPLTYSQLNELRTKFPVDWLEFLVDCKHDSSLTSNLKEKLADLVMVCFALTDVGTSSQFCGGRVEETKPFDILEGFCGRFPYSTHSNWLNGDHLLTSLLLKAYRYACDVVIRTIICIIISLSSSQLNPPSLGVVHRTYIM